MAQNINDAVAYLQTLVAAITGMRQAPAEPTEQALFPFAVSYVSALVSSTGSPGAWQKNDYEITTEIHVARKDLSRDYAGIRDFAVTFPAAVWGDYNANHSALGGYVSTVNSISGQLAPSTWGGIETLAWTFKTQVKVNSAWTT